MQTIPLSSLRFDRISPLLSRLQWLKASERITYNVAVLAPTCLCDELRRPAKTEARRRLRSALSTTLDVRRTRLSTVGDRAFPVAAARPWNSLPSHVTAAPSLSPSSAVVLYHNVISSHFLIPLYDSSLICTVPAQRLVILDTIIALHLFIVSTIAAIHLVINVTRRRPSSPKSDSGRPPREAVPRSPVDKSAMSSSSGLGASGLSSTSQTPNQKGMTSICCVGVELTICFSLNIAVTG